MKRYPITVHRASYRGSDPKKRAKIADYNRVASVVERHLNEELAKSAEDSITVFMSYDVAIKTGQPDKLVHEIIHATDGGSGGITCWKGDYDKAIKNPRGSQHQ